MSSRRSEEEPEGQQRRGFFGRFETWRVMMLAGAVILLAAALGRAMVDDFPRSASLVANIGGYVLLAGGFAERMRTRNK
jgi:hypothetical protein